MCAVRQREQRRIAATGRIGGDLFERRADCLEDTPERHVFAERHDPHLLVAAGDAVVGLDHVLRVHEAVGARIGTELRVERDAHCEWHTEPVDLTIDLQKRGAVGECAAVDIDSVLGPHDQVEVVPGVDRRCRIQMRLRHA